MSPVGFVHALLCSWASVPIAASKPAFTTTTAMETDIISDWNSTASYGVDVVTDEFHTYDTSFFMEEPMGPFGELADVLVGIVIDNSPSMTDRTCPDGTGRSYLAVAKDAAIGMLNEFTDESAVGIYAFQGAKEEELIEITFLGGTGRQDGRPNRESVP